MGTQAARLGLWAAAAAVLAVGWPADANETAPPAPMTKKEASAFQKEITAKYKEFQAEYQAASKELDDFWAMRVWGPGADLHVASLEKKAAENRDAATKKLMEGLRACIDAANGVEPGSASAGTVQGTLAKIDLLTGKVWLKDAKGNLVLQESARKACEPVAIYTCPAQFRFGYRPAGSLLPDRRLLVAQIEYCVGSSLNRVSGGGIIECRSSNPDAEECGVAAGSVIVELETTTGITEIEATVGPDGHRFDFAATAVFSDGSDRDISITVRPWDTDPTLFQPDAIDLTVPAGVLPPDEEECVSVVATLLVNGSPGALADFTGAERTRLGDRTTVEAVWSGGDEAKRTFDFAALILTGVDTTGPLDIDIVQPEEFDVNATNGVAYDEELGFVDGTLHLNVMENLLLVDSTGAVSGYFETTGGDYRVDFSICPDSLPVVDPPCIELFGVDGGATFDFDPVNSGSRENGSTYVRMSIGASSPNAGSPLVLFLNLMKASTPASGQIQVPVVTSSPLTANGAEVILDGPPLTGTLAIYNVEAILQPGHPGPIRMRFVSTDGTLVIDFCIQPNQVPFP